MIEATPTVIAIAALVAAAALGLSAASWWRARQQAATGSRIELLTSRYLGGKKVLSLVEVEGERLLLAVCGNGIRLVARFRPGKDRTTRRHGVDRAPALKVLDIGDVLGNVPVAEPEVSFRRETE
jgi:flagellar biogenesis protein FliO